MKLTDFFYRWVGRRIADKIDLKEGYMEDTKKWYQSKNIWTGVVTAIVGLYLSLAPQFHWPNIPDWIFTILGAIGVYTRVTASTKIG